MFCIDWVRPVWLVWPAGGTLPLLQSTGVCHNQQAGSWCRAAKVNWDWLVHTASVEPESHCPWPEGSGPDCTAALWTKGEFRKLGMFESPRLQQGTTPRRIISGHVNHSKDGTIFKMYHCADSSENYIGVLTSVVIVNYQKSFSVIEIMLKQNINIYFFF